MDPNNGQPGLDGTGIRVDYGGTFMSSGGSVIGGSFKGSIGYPATIGGSAIAADGASQISGGTFRGADGAAGGVGAIFGIHVAAGTTSISGGTFQGGNAVSGYGGNGGGYGGNGASYVGSGLDISGGQFQGGNGVTPYSAGGNGLVILLAGPPSGGVATISGGTFLGGSGPYSTSSQGNALAHYGNVNGGDLAQLNVSGGIFSGTIYYDTTEYSETAASEINFFGSGFAYDASTGAFSGILQDGNAIDVTMILGQRTRYEIDSSNEVSFLVSQ